MTPSLPRSAHGAKARYLMPEPMTDEERGRLARSISNNLFDRPLPPEGYRQIVPSHRTGFGDPAVAADCTTKHTAPKAATVTTRLLLRGTPLIVTEMCIYKGGPALFLKHYAPHVLERELRDRWFRRQKSWAARAGALLRNEWPDFAPLPKPDLAVVEHEVRALELAYPPTHPQAAKIALGRVTDVIEELGDFVCFILREGLRGEVLPWVVADYESAVWVERIVAQWAAKSFGETPESVEARRFVASFEEDQQAA